ncbi:MAG: maleylacetoacetate isomerase [Alphaproteobacteria bacterium]|nr:maleylacetoacetate isomerase [Alphaproteobacteria bacterium]
MKLFGYWRSSATYRIRILLNLKGVAYDYEAVDLRAGDQRGVAHLARNPQALVPVLETDGGKRLVQSQAIAEYLEETIPEPSILPKSPEDRARARAIAAAIACEAQPFMNLRVQQYLKQDVGLDDPSVHDWLQHWGGGAMKAVESLIDAQGQFAVGDAPGLAEAFIVPQLYAAQRFKLNLDALPRMKRVAAACAELAAFQDAHPDAQPDAQPDVQGR